MSEITAAGGPRQYLHVFRRYVLGPLTAAETCVDRERTEIDAERRAFEAFAEAVRDVTSPPERSGRPSVQQTLVDPSNDVAAEIREAYRDTVMSVDHYDAEYGESLEENVLAEFGPDLAQLVRPGGGRSFSDAHRRTLTGRAEQAARERESFLDVLERERESLRSARRAIREIVESLDDTLIPGWYRREFESRVDRIATERQSTIQGRSSLSRFEPHSLCEYLYRDEPWTYPVLTSVARLRDSVGVHH